jgi:hypothetical protein
MAYTGNPSTSAPDAVRLYIGDISTSTASELFSDGEIDFFVAEYANSALAAAAAVKSIIGTSRAKTVAGAVSKQVGDLKLDYGNIDVAGILTGKAKQLRVLGVRKVKPYAGGISESDKDATESDTDLDNYHFRIGQFDHPGLGVNSTSTF